MAAILSLPQCVNQESEISSEHQVPPIQNMLCV